MYQGIERTGYVRFKGNTKSRSFEDLLLNFSKNEIGLSKDHVFGEAKFEFVALRDDDTIAIYHTQSNNNFFKTINGSKKAKEVKVEGELCKIM